MCGSPRYGRVPNPRRPIREVEPLLEHAVGTSLVSVQKQQRVGAADDDRRLARRLPFLQHVGQIQVDDVTAVLLSELQATGAARGLQD